MCVFCSDVGVVRDVISRLRLNQKGRGDAISRSMRLRVASLCWSSTRPGQARASVHGQACVRSGSAIVICRRAGLPHMHA